MKKNYFEKTFQTELKDLDVKKGIVEGYFSSWGIVDADGDELMPGAYTKSLNERGPGIGEKSRIQHLVQHTSTLPVHRFTDPETLKEDNIGLWFRSKITQTTYGKDLLLLYQDGVINEHSVGIQIVKGGQAPEGHNQVTEVILWEGSSVTWGANAATPVTAVKSMNDEEKAEYFCKKIDSLSKALFKGTYTDETFMMLEIQLKQIQAHYLDAVGEPEENSTPKPDEKSTGSNLVTVDLKI